MKALLEVESKFRFKESLLTRFRSNQGNPPFNRLTFLRTHVFQDTYYDHANVLSKNGIWIRERADGKSKALEAKKRITGDYTRSTFEEITDGDTIRALIRQYLPQQQQQRSSSSASSSSCLEQQQQSHVGGLDVMARFTTSRQLFVADDRFSIMLDRTDFGHSVGEVELEAEDAGSAHREIDAFLRKYSWFCEGGGPVEGKLSAYFRLHGK
ncbi:MAG: hypothetical protein M1837_004344 [Sclerophora amabilis]|nr:MAG: hypothetical protein M1837_004344 [Sclerophora amabilis]